MMKLSIEELCETAESLIAPVRLGVARPTAPFTLSNSNPDQQVLLDCDHILFFTLKLLI